MRKFVALMSALVILFGTLCLSASAETQYGDLYEDGIVDVKDAVILSQYLAKWTSVSFSDEQKKAADVFHDGSIDVKDAVKLARYLAGWTVCLGDSSPTAYSDIEYEYGDIFE